MRTCEQSIPKHTESVKFNVLPLKTIDFIGDIFGYGKDIIPNLHVPTSCDYRERRLMLNSLRIR